MRYRTLVKTQVIFLIPVGLYMDMRGFGPVKEKAVSEVREIISRRLSDYIGVDRQAA